MRVLAVPFYTVDDLAHKIAFFYNRQRVETLLEPLQSLYYILDLLFPLDMFIVNKTNLGDFGLQRFDFAVQPLNLFSGVGEHCGTVFGFRERVHQIGNHFLLCGILIF